MNTLSFPLPYHFFHYTIFFRSWSKIQNYFYILMQKHSLLQCMAPEDFEDCQNGKHIGDNIAQSVPTLLGAIGSKRFRMYGKNDYFYSQFRTISLYKIMTLIFSSLIFKLLQNEKYANLIFSVKHLTKHIDALSGFISL